MANLAEPLCGIDATSVGLLVGLLRSQISHELPPQTASSRASGCIDMPTIGRPCSMVAIRLPASMSNSKVRGSVITAKRVASRVSAINRGLSSKSNFARGSRFLAGRFWSLFTFHAHTSRSPTIAASRDPSRGSRRRNCRGSDARTRSVNTSFPAALRRLLPRVETSCRAHNRCPRYRAVDRSVPADRGAAYTTGATSSTSSDRSCELLATCRSAYSPTLHPTGDSR